MANPVLRDRTLLDDDSQMRLERLARMMPTHYLAQRVHVPTRELHRALAGETLRTEYAQRIRDRFNNRY